jgi:membrane protein required for colicin V production
MIITQMDWVILGLIGLSALVGIWRGLAQELIALAAWVVSIWASIVYAPELGASWTASIPNEELRTLLAWLAIMSAVLVIGAIIRILVGKLIASTPLKLPNHFFGGLFGFARGVLFLSVLVLFAHLTFLPKQSWWEASSTIPLLEKVTHYYLKWIPEDMKQSFLKHFPHKEAFFFKKREKKSFNHDELN